MKMDLVLLSCKMLKKHKDYMEYCNTLFIYFYIIKQNTNKINTDKIEWHS